MNRSSLCLSRDGGSNEASAVARHRVETHACHVVPERRLRFKNAVAEATPCVGQRQKLLPNTRAVGQAKAADTADLIAQLSVLDRARFDRRMPCGMPVEVPQDRPNRLDGRVDDGAATNLDPP